MAPACAPCLWAGARVAWSPGALGRACVRSFPLVCVMVELVAAWTRAAKVFVGAWLVAWPCAGVVAGEEGPLRVGSAVDSNQAGAATLALVGLPAAAWGLCLHACSSTNSWSEIPRGRHPPEASPRWGLMNSGFLRSYFLAKSAVNSCQRQRKETTTRTRVDRLSLFVFVWFPVAGFRGSSSSARCLELCALTQRAQSRRRATYVVLHSRK